MWGQGRQLRSNDSQISIVKQHIITNSIKKKHREIVMRTNKIQDTERDKLDVPTPSHRNAIPISLFSFPLTLISRTSGAPPEHFTIQSKNELGQSTICLKIIYLTKINNPPNIRSLLGLYHQQNVQSLSRDVISFFLLFGFMILSVVRILLPINHVLGHGLDDLRFGNRNVGLWI